MVRILVLGSSGRIGTMLRTFWLQTASDNTDITFTFQTRCMQEDHPDDLLWDIFDPLPESASQYTHFDCMIVMAGIVPKSDACFALNTAIGQASITAASQLSIPRVLLASTSAVYGTFSDAPLSENDPLVPINDYGHSKRIMEEVCHEHARILGLDLCCLRIGNVAGADALLLNAATLEQGQTLQLDMFTDGGTPVRSYIGPHSLGRVLLSLARTNPTLPDHLNVAAPEPVSMGALAKAAEVPTTLHLVKDDTHQYITLDCTTLTTLYRFDPSEADPGEMVRQWRTYN